MRGKLPAAFIAAPASIAAAADKIEQEQNII